MFLTLVRFGDYLGEGHKQWGEWAFLINRSISDFHDIYKRVNKNFPFNYIADEYNDNSVDICFIHDLINTYEDDEGFIADLFYVVSGDTAEEVAYFIEEDDFKKLFIFLMKKEEPDLKIEPTEVSTLEINGGYGLFND